MAENAVKRWADEFPTRTGGRVDPFDDLLPLLAILIGVAWSLAGLAKLERLSELYLWLALPLSLNILYDWAGGAAGRMLRTLDGYTHGIHSHWVTGLEFSPDGRQLASCGGDLVLKIWELSSGRGITRRG